VEVENDTYGKMSYITATRQIWVHFRFFLLTLCRHLV